MAKAALNMMTRTAALEYQEDKIYMTSVDTGWVSDERPFFLAKKEEKMDVLEDMFEKLMSEEMGGDMVKPMDLMMMLIQAKTGNMHADPQKSAMLMVIMRNLAKRSDPQARGILSKLSSKLILNAVMPSKLPEEDMWRYVSSLSVIDFKPD